MWIAQSTFKKMGKGSLKIMELFERQKKKKKKGRGVRRRNLLSTVQLFRNKKLMFSLKCIN